MTARAMWKAVIRLGDERVPVKLYAAVQDRRVHFRLLHRSDHAPVRQAMVDPHSGDVVARSDALRAVETEDGDVVLLREDELSDIEPEPSRDIHVLCALPPAAIDHRWYLRPYYLGPDGSLDRYFALSAALARSGRECLARWVMRNKTYVGALRLHAGYPVLVALRNAEEVVPIEDLEIPAGPPLDERELGMARQLVDMLADDFDPSQYHDSYRERVEDLIETKRRGGRVRKAPAPPRRPAQDLTRALEASLKQGAAMPEPERSNATESRPEGASKAPRSFWSGTLAFGLVRIPVDLFVGHRSAGVPLHQVTAEGTPLRQR